MPLDYSKIQPRPELCKCGCNKPVNTGKMFVQGHHVKAFRMLIKLSKGEIKLAEMPRTVRQLAQMNGVQFNMPLPASFPKFKNRYSK